MDTVVEVKDLTKVYGDLVAVDGVNFEIEKGVFGLVCPNGAGKTTTVEMIDDLRKPDSGAIKVCGIDAAKGMDKAKCADLPNSPLRGKRSQSGKHLGEEGGPGGCIPGDDGKEAARIRRDDGLFSKSE